MTNQTPTAADQQPLVQKLTGAQELYTLLSLCSKAPYVMCDAETFDDEIFLFFIEADAKAEMEQRKAHNEPTGPVKLDQKQLLGFLGSLYTLGINALVLVDGARREQVQLDAVVKRNIKKDEKNTWIENPALHLTALTFAQELRRPKESRDAQKLAELQEELQVDFLRGTFIAAVQKDTPGIPLVKMPDGSLNQPLFTDIIEFQKFNREQKFKAVPVPAGKLPDVMAKEAKGVVLNPLEVSLSLTVTKNQPKPRTAEEAVNRALAEME